MMRMTKQADYGIVLMTLFAKGLPEDPVLSARDLAQEASLPLPTVTKILKALARDGLLTSHRGVNGGYRLARTPAQVTVGQIITALEGPIAITQCAVNATGCGREPFCPTRGNWRRIDEAVRDALDHITLEEMAHPLPRRAEPHRASASLAAGPASARGEEAL
ncbi:MAG: SUF system Fe-S cluster assembly regulator [Deltaproteobacteria bacterium]|nr:SUF system Fe-S cluster assembly regulator [Deltaproteobacteria bacterium]